MARRNKVSQAPVLIVMMVIVAVWLFAQGGSEISLRSPAGMLLLLGLLLLVNMLLRKRARPQRQPATVVRSAHIQVPRPPARGRYVSDRPAFSRTSRAANPEIWPYDGSYCLHCGLKRRGGETLCLRCGQIIEPVLKEK